VIPIMVMIVFVPIAICVPAVSVLIPPFVDAVPAIFARLVQLLPGMVCLAAVPPMMLNSLVDPVICFGESMLAGVIVGRRPRRSAQQQEPSHRYRCQCCSYKPLPASCQKFLHFGIPPESAQGKGWRSASQYRRLDPTAMSLFEHSCSRCIPILFRITILYHKKEQSTGPKSRAPSILFSTSYPVEISVY
jgi:hypothetical protein